MGTTQNSSPFSRLWWTHQATCCCSRQSMSRHLLTWWTQESIGHPLPTLFKLSKYTLVSLSMSKQSLSSVSLHEDSFTGEIVSQWPEMVSRHVRMQLSSSWEGMILACGMAWYKRRADIKRKDGWAGSGIECIVQSLTRSLIDIRTMGTDLPPITCTS